MKKFILLVTLLTSMLFAYSQNNGICMVIRNSGETTYHDAQVDISTIGDDYYMYVAFSYRNYTFHYTIVEAHETDKYTYFYNSDGSVFGISKDPYAEYKYIYRTFTTISGEYCELFMLFNK